MWQTHDETAVPSRVLVVDDDRDCADSLNAILSKMGHESAPLYHPVTVSQSAHIFRPDLMLIDLAMPNVDGCELVQELRKDEALSDATLIAMTGYADSFHRQAAFEAGFDGFLVKPFGSKELKALIANLDEIRAQARALRLDASDLLQYGKETDSCSAELIQLSLRIQQEWSAITEQLRHNRRR